MDARSYEEKAIRSLLGEGCFVKKIDPAIAKLNIGRDHYHVRVPAGKFLPTVAAIQAETARLQSVERVESAIAEKMAGFVRADRSEAMRVLGIEAALSLEDQSTLQAMIRGG
jgi:hypothetical protein